MSDQLIFSFLQADCSWVWEDYFTDDRWVQVRHTVQFANNLKSLSPSIHTHIHTLLGHFVAVLADVILCQCSKHIVPWDVHSLRRSHISHAVQVEICFDVFHHFFPGTDVTTQHTLLMSFAWVKCFDTAWLKNLSTLIVCIYLSARFTGNTHGWLIFVRACLFLLRSCCLKRYLCSTRGMLILKCFCNQNVFFFFFCNAQSILTLRYVVYVFSFKWFC